jgi:hypothetical protein
VSQPNRPMFFGGLEQFAQPLKKLPMRKSNLHFLFPLWASMGQKYRALVDQHVRMNSEGKITVTALLGVLLLTVTDRLSNFNFADFKFCETRQWRR